MLTQCLYLKPEKSFFQRWLKVAPKQNTGTLNSVRFGETFRGKDTIGYNTIMDCRTILQKQRMGADKVK
jgi:hypothetical protein